MDRDGHLTRDGKGPVLGTFRFPTVTLTPVGEAWLAPDYGRQTAPVAIDAPPAETPLQRGFVHDLPRDREEEDIVNGMQAWGASAELIQDALEAHRRDKGRQGASDGGTRPTSTDERAPAVPSEPTRQALQGVEIRNREEYEIADKLANTGATKAAITNALNAFRRQNGTAPKPGHASDATKRKIEEALRSSDRGIRHEGEVAQTLLDAGIDIIDIQKRILRESGDPEIEFDIETKNSIIEVTKEEKGKLKAVRRRLDTKFNPNGKNVIVYSESHSDLATRSVEAAGGHVIRTPEELSKYLRDLERKND